MQQKAFELAQELLDSPDPLASVRADLCEIGLEHDLEPAMLAYLVATSRLGRRPLWCTVTGDTGAGKSHLKDLIASMVPETERLEAAEMTPQALIYRATNGTLNLSGTLLVGDERSLNGPEARYVRTLYEAGRVRKLTVKGGRSVTLAIESCPAAIDTTTATEFFEEDQNRRIVVAVSESAAKYAEVLSALARSYQGAGPDHDAIVVRQQNVQSLLPRQTTVLIPFSGQITPSQTSAPGGRAVRSFAHILSLVEAVALLRHRRRVGPNKVIIATIDDYAAAYELYAPISQHALGEVSAQAKSLAENIDAGVGDLAGLDVRRHGFARKDISRWSDLSKATLERRLPELISSGLLLVVRSGGKGRGHEYVLAPDWREVCNRATGLIPPGRICVESPARTDRSNSGDERSLSAADPTPGVRPEDCQSNAHDPVGIAQSFDPVTVS